MGDRYTYTIKLDGKELENQSFFDKFNWQYFFVLDAVYVEGNDEIPGVAVFFTRNAGQEIYLMSRGAIMNRIEEQIRGF